MTPAELSDFIRKNVPVFSVMREMEGGSAFHYTSQRAGIERTKMFLGAEVNADLDHTQVALVSPPAKHDPGVVFAYENLIDSAEEGDKCDIIEVEYTGALLAMHTQESALGDLLAVHTQESGHSTPPTLLIINRDITRFRYVGIGRDLYADPTSAVPSEWIICSFGDYTDATPTTE